MKNRRYLTSLTLSLSRPGATPSSMHVRTQRDLSIFGQRHTMTRCGYAQQLDFVLFMLRRPTFDRHRLHANHDEA